MSNGDLVSVDAKHEKVIKMRSNGERLAERHVPGATRGVSVCMDDRIYVLVEGGPCDDVVYLLDVQNGNVTAIQPPENSVYGLGMCSKTLHVDPKHLKISTHINKIYESLIVFVISASSALTAIATPVK
ncbi:hypothetical protein T06_9043 [Trichinella sp. T6]|nr:hypothetical protein T06_9043 [Trichinella sp. T6]